MLKKPASVVLASLRSSTYRSVRFASSLAAALLDGPFEHPARGSPVALDKWIINSLLGTIVFRRRLDRTMPNHANENAFDLKRI